MFNYVIRTQFSGITPDMIREKGEPFEVVQKEVADIIKDRIVVGHGLKNDFKVCTTCTPPFLTCKGTTSVAPIPIDKGHCKIRASTTAQRTSSRFKIFGQKNAQNKNSNGTT